MSANELVAKIISQKVQLINLWQVVQRALASLDAESIISRVELLKAIANFNAAVIKQLETKQITVTPEAVAELYQTVSQAGSSLQLTEQQAHACFALRNALRLLPHTDSLNIQLLDKATRDRMPEISAHFTAAFEQVLTYGIKLPKIANESSEAIDIPALGYWLDDRSKEQKIADFKNFCISDPEVNNKLQLVLEKLGKVDAKNKSSQLEFLQAVDSLADVVAKLLVGLNRYTYTADDMVDIVYTLLEQKWQKIKSNSGIKKITKGNLLPLVSLVNGFAYISTDRESQTLRKAVEQIQNQRSDFSEKCYNYNSLFSIVIGLFGGEKLFASNREKNYRVLIEFFAGKADVIIDESDLDKLPDGQQNTLAGRLGNVATKIGSFINSITATLATAVTAVVEHIYKGLAKLANAAANLVFFRSKNNSSDAGSEVEITKASQQVSGKSASFISVESHESVKTKKFSRGFLFSRKPLQFRKKPAKPEPGSSTEDELSESSSVPKLGNSSYESES